MEAEGSGFQLLRERIWRERVKTRRRDLLVICLCVWSDIDMGETQKENNLFFGA